jgi:hypothetical protein
LLAQIIPFIGGQNGGTLISAEEKCYGTELCPLGQNSGVLELKKGGHIKQNCCTSEKNTKGLE